MATSIFFNDFLSPAAMNLAVDWLDVLDRAVRRAARRTVMLDFGPVQGGQHAAYEKLLDNLNPASGRSENAERFYRARLGYVIESECNAYLVAAGRRRGWHMMDGQPPASANAGDFLLQTPGPYGPCFPCDFRGPAGKGSRPDIRVALGDGTEALFDITSRGQEGHVLTKGDGQWLRTEFIAFIAEVIYDEDEVARDIFEGSA